MNQLEGIILKLIFSRYRDIEREPVVWALCLRYPGGGGGFPKKNRNEVKSK